MTIYESTKFPMEDKMGNLESSHIKCSFCDSRSIYCDRIRGLLFCTNHLENLIHDRVKKVLSARIRTGDRVGIALSGGKDSTVLLYLLHTLVNHHENVELVALTVDEGICGYREHSLLAAEKHARRLGIPHMKISFVEMAGAPLDTLVRGHEERSCTICGILRRKALLQLAREHAVTVIATGHCLNDEAQTILMNILRGDLSSLLRTPQEDKRFIPRIKPLAHVSEKEITVYAMSTGIYVDLPECPYAHYALRSEVRSMLDRFEQATSGTLERVISFHEQLSASRIQQIPIPAPIPCNRCGEPSVTGLCRACSILGSNSQFY